MKGNITVLGQTINLAQTAPVLTAPLIRTPIPDNWQSYLRRFSRGLNGITDRSETITEADIVARAEKYMKIKYPGNYTVEQYYNKEKMKWDLRLKFDDPKHETMWLIKWS